MMPRWQRAYVLATCALIAGAFAYAACDWGQWPRLAYLPLHGVLTLHPPPGALAITYIGSVAWGLSGAACGLIVGAALCAFVKRPWTERWLRLFGAWAITAILLAGSYETWNLWPW
jgi:hypothetical protein